MPCTQAAGSAPRDSDWGIFCDSTVTSARLRGLPDPSMPAVTALCYSVPLTDVFDCRYLVDKVRSDGLFRLYLMSMKLRCLTNTLNNLRGQCMRRLVNGVLLLVLAVAPGFASTIFFQGTFAADNQVALFQITANTSETITIKTD